MTKTLRLICEPITSLIERVMMNDFNLFKNDALMTSKTSEMNFNRIETFQADTLLYKGLEYIQRDFQFNTPLHYFNRTSFDQEIDIVLQRVFDTVDKGNHLPIAEQNIHAAMF